MSNTISVRAATPADVDALVDFNQRMAAETEDKPLADEVIRAGVSAIFADAGKGRYWMAEAGSNNTADETSAAVLAGTLMVTLEWSDWRNGWFWWIQSVYVAPEFRRRGVYRAMHDSVRTAARDAGECVGIRLYVERENSNAMATYRAMGMHETVYRLFEETF